jgi:hypothetical protein
MDAYHGHAHLLENFGVISRTSKTRAYSTEGAWVGRKDPFESILFLEIIEVAPIIIEVAPIIIEVAPIIMFNGECSGRPEDSV